MSTYKLGKQKRLLGIRDVATVVIKYVGHFAKDCPGIIKKGGDSNPGGRTVDGVQESHSKSKISAVDSALKWKSAELSHVKCYNCGEKGHIATTCPANVTKAHVLCGSEQQLLSMWKASSVCWSGQIGEVTVDNIVLDTRTMVKEDLVQGGQYL